LNNLNSDRDLLFVVFLSGDGNFHLQSKLRCKDLKVDPALFGDSAFFTPILTTQNYIEAAKKSITTDKVSFHIYSLNAVV
jgi:hypothetical protein